MRWETLGRAPEWMWDGATAVDDNTVYITLRYSHHVWAYDVKEDKWTRLPDLAPIPKSDEEARAT